MRILHTVQFYEPHLGGSEEVVRQLSERLVRRGHDVTVATAFDSRRTSSQLNGVKIEQFKISGNRAYGIRGDVDAYRRFLTSVEVDVMMNYAAQIWSTDLAFDVLPDIDSARVMVPCGYNFGDPRLRSYLEELPGYLSRYDALVYMSAHYQDKEFGDRVGLGHLATIIPNGAAEEEFGHRNPSFRETYGITTPLMALTVSNHYPPKGHLRLIRAFKDLRRDDTTLAIIGEHEGVFRRSCYPYCRAQSLVDRRIKVLTGVPRELVVGAYQDADIFCLTSDIECAPLVIYEAMAAGVPFVSTPAGNVRDNARFGRVVSGERDIASAMNELLSAPELRREMGREARKEWKRAHTWDTIVDRYEELYSRLVQSA